MTTIPILDQIETAQWFTADLRRHGHIWPGAETEQARVTRLEKGYAIISTLQWLYEHESEIREWLDARRSAG